MPFSTLRADLSSANDNLASAKANILAIKATIKWLETRIAEETALGNDTSSLESQKTTVEASLSSAEANLTGPSGPVVAVQSYMNTYNGYSDTQKKQTIEECGDQYPILLLPVRLEVHFENTGSGYELWVRFYPDEAAIHDHEEPLTRREFDAALAYQTAIAQGGITDAEKLAQWDQLVKEFGRERAAYLGHFVDTSAGDYNSYTSKKPGSWNEPTVTKALPDFFVVSCYSTYDIQSPPTTADVEKVSGKVIPDVLDVGLDPNQAPGTHPEETDGLKWMYDFTEAINKGMGMKIPISSTQFANGFDRITAVGVKTHRSTADTKARIEGLFKNHHYSQGMAFLKTGEDTKNTEKGRSNYGSTDLGNENTHAVECEGPLFTSSSHAINKPNGQWLANALGIDLSIFENIENAERKDITNAMRMSDIVYPATLGRTLRSWFGDSLTINDLNETHEFFTSYVKARGALPGIRVNRQPYGVLPASSYANFTLHVGTPNPTYHNGVKGVLDGVEPEWRAASGAQPKAGTSDPLDVFADVMGRSATSKRFFKRAGVGPEYTWNNLVFYDKAGDATTWENSRQNLKTDINNDFGINLNADSPILGASFHSAAGELTMPVVEDLPASNTRALQPIGSTSTNYITWLKDATVKELIDEDFTGIGATAQDAPNNLLYLYLRQSMLLQYHETACSLLGKSESEKRDYELLNFTNPELPSEGGPAAGDLLTTPGSRLSIFDEEYPAASGQAMGTYLDNTDLSAVTEAEKLVEFKEHLEAFEELPTSELELLTVEVIDVVTNRFDAWRVGLVSQKLIAMRDSQATGLFVGGYGWLEDVRAVSKTADTTDWSGETNFTDLDSETVWKNDDNKGYILAPSLQHATTAALLRAGYDSEADSSDSRSHEINLSSQRVRKTSEIFNGLRNGQKLGLLMGYEIERGLHDKDIVLNQYVYELRKAFPFNTITDDPSQPEELIRARNVVNGMKLIKAYRAEDRDISDFNDTYNLNILEGPAPDNHQTKIAQVLDYAESLLDAISDMATAEGAFELTKGNMQNANAAIAAVSGGRNLPESTIKKTPRTGKGIVNKIMLKIPVNASAIASNWAASTTPLSTLEPSLNAWIGNLLGNGSDLGCTVSIKHKGLLPDPIESCYKFTGDNHIEILDLDDSAPEGGLYISFRIKLVPGHENKDTTILGLGDMKLTQGDGTDNSIRLIYENSGTQTVDTGIVLDTKNWMKLDIRIVDDSLKIWINDETTASHNEASFAITVPTSGYKVYMASNTDGSTGLGYFYLSDIECYDIGTETVKRNRIAHYRCSEGSGTEVKDRTFNQNHGTLSGASAHSFDECFVISLDKLGLQPYDLASLYDGSLADDDSSISSLIKAKVKEERLLVHSAQINIDYTAVNGGAEPLVSGASPSIPLVDEEVLLKYIKRVLANSKSVKSSDFLASGEQTLADIDQYDYDDFETRVSNFKTSFKQTTDQLKYFLDNYPTSYSGQDFQDLKDNLDLLRTLGVKEAVYDYQIETDEVLYQEILSSALTLHKQLAKKVTKVDALWENVASTTDEDKARSVRILHEVIKEILGNGILVMPKIQLLNRTKASIQQQYADSANYPSTLLNDHGGTTAASLLALDEWIQGLARVRQKIGDFELLTTIADANGAGNLSILFNSFELKPLQFPYDNNKWMALPVDDEADLVGGCNCIALSGWDTPYSDCNGDLVALLIDEWNEVLPSREELGGMTFHYDQPNAQAPQSLLLAVPPSNRGYWEFDDLTKTINETFDLAKMRAVEYSELATTKLGHLLPLALTPVSNITQTADIHVDTNKFA